MHLQIANRREGSKLFSSSFHRILYSLLVITLLRILTTMGHFILVCCRPVFNDLQYSGIFLRFEFGTYKIKMKLTKKVDANDEDI